MRLYYNYNCFMHFTGIILFIFFLSKNVLKLKSSSFFINLMKTFKSTTQFKKIIIYQKIIEKLI